MTILYTGRKAHLTPALRLYTEKKLSKLERVLESIEDAHVILSLEKHRQIAEILVKGRDTTLTAKTETTDFRDSIGECVDRLLAQAKKHHERVAKERKREGMRASPRRADRGFGELPAVDAGADSDGPSVVRMGRFAAKPMSVEEALLQVQDSRDPVLVFRNVESQQVAVLFRRSDGRFGLVEEEA